MAPRMTMASDDAPIPLKRPFDMDEAAKQLMVSKRTLTDLIKRHPHYSWGGRKKAFYPEDGTGTATWRRPLYSALNGERAIIEGSGMETIPNGRSSRYAFTLKPPPPQP